MKYQKLFLLQKAIRAFFNEREFLDVLTPPMVQNPGMEAHLHPFQVFSIEKQKRLPFFLHTSPEFHMKELLSEGYKNIFTMSYCFRDEPKSHTHRPQFLMLEWYRALAVYEEIENDVIDLIEYCQKALGIEEKQKIESFTVEEAFLKFANFSILDSLSSGNLKAVIEKKFPFLLPKEELSLEDYFYLIFLNIIEPELKKLGIVILKEYPESMAALSLIKKEDPRVCKRFEVYIGGIEIANCFEELTDLDIQKKRFQKEESLKEKLYQYKLPQPSQFYQSLENGLPPSSGIALGVERLLMALTKEKTVFFDSHPIK